MYTTLNKMNILFTVCGRAGSKGIKNKNIRDFLGVPLIYYTFSAIDLYVREYPEHNIEVVVNTDSEELIKIAEENPFFRIDVVRRSEELGGDRVAKTLVVLDSLENMSERTQNTYDMVVDLDITSPLRKAEDIKKLISVQQHTKCDVVFSVTNARRNPYFNMVVKSEKGYKKVLDSNYVARQQAPAMFDMNASLYAYNPNFLRRKKGVLDGYCEVIKMEDTGILDLDHESDFELMEVIAKYLFEKKPSFGDIYRNIVAKGIKE